MFVYGNINYLISLKDVFYTEQRTSVKYALVTVHICAYEQTHCYNSNIYLNK